MEKQLDALSSKLEEAFGPRLISVVLYGSAAVDDWQDGASDLNILAVLTEIDIADMRRVNATFEWWSKQGHTAPVLLTEDELMHSTDCFAIELRDMQERRRVLRGRDVIADLSIDFRYYRAHVEREFRNKQIRLRRKAVGLIDDHQKLMQLMTDSISTFCVLARHALLLNDGDAQWKKRDVLAALASVAGNPMHAAQKVLAHRESGERLAAVETVALLGEYLKDIDGMVRFVDGLSK